MTAQPALGGRRALFGALILGAIAAGLIVAFLASRSSDDGGDAVISAPVSVVVAKADIAAGTKIDKGMLEVRDVPRELLVAGTLTSISDVDGEVARYPIAKGEQVGGARLVEAASVKSLSFQIPAGLRGYTVAVSTDTSPAALLAPGDFVDIIVSASLLRLSTIAGASNQLLTNQEEPNAAVTLLQNVQVLSVQRKYVDNGVPYDSSTRGEPPAEDDDVNFVTLAVTPQQAQILWLAAQDGKMTLTLRGFGDEKVTELTPDAEPIRIR
jgi:pilus assembly protein CpaB